MLLIGMLQEEGKRATLSAGVRRSCTLWAGKLRDAQYKLDEEANEPDDDEPQPSAKRNLRELCEQEKVGVCFKAPRRLHARTRGASATQGVRWDEAARLFCPASCTS